MAQHRVSRNPAEAGGAAGRGLCNSLKGGRKGKTAAGARRLLIITPTGKGVGKMRSRIVLSALVLSCSWQALGQGRGERADRARMPFMPPVKRRQAQEPAAMALSGGKLYLVVGNTLSKLDAESLEVAKTAEIPVAGAEKAEEQDPRQERFAAAMKERLERVFERLDKDGDGVLREDELLNPEPIRLLDKDADGAISREELPEPQLPKPPAGPASILVEKGSVYVFQNGWLYRFGADDLSLAAKAEVAGPSEGGMDVFRLLRPAMKRRPEKRPPREGREGGEEDEAPEEPTRF